MPKADTRPRGRALLRDPRLNRGTAFTTSERVALELDGLLPPAVMTLEEQARRSYEQYRAQPDDLARNVFLAGLHDRNQTLYFKLLEDHLKEMLPVVYDPVVAQAIERYSEQFRRPSGVYLSIDDIDGVERALANFGLQSDEVDLIVATDGEQILGIGDWGANSMAISVGKLAVYTAAAGIDPGRVIPVVLDAGTNNQALLNDPLYVGNRHSRVSDERYDALIEAYIEAASTMFPDALLHFEDFGPSNARRILTRYRDRVRIFNDDMQGTGAIVLAAVLAGARMTATTVRDQRVVIFGAGTAGVGIADQLRSAMVRDGLDKDEATARVWLVDRQGLLLEGMDDLRDFQRPYARPRAEVSGWGTGEGPIDLAAVAEHTKPTILIGTSTVPGAFTEAIVREVARHAERPFILPLSNPTERMEASPTDIIEWTDGRALVAAGIPWDPVTHDGTEFQIGQANNALVYPGIGLGTIASRAGRVTDGMLASAATAIADLVPGGDRGATILPDVQNLRASSASVAVAVARAAAQDGVAASDLEAPVQAVQDAMWQARYPELDID
jgi:malate dehydrogenase (oxaloacetate-decarboxylating)